MVHIINALLDLWDPYKIILFPKDEYTSEAKEIQKFIETEKNFNSDTLANFVFNLLPPIIAPNEIDIGATRLEYERFAKALILVLKK